MNKEGVILVEFVVVRFAETLFWFFSPGGGTIFERDAYILEDWFWWWTCNWLFCLFHFRYFNKVSEEVPAIRAFISSTIPSAILSKSPVDVVGASPVISGYTDNCGYNPFVVEDFRFIVFRFGALFLLPFVVVAGVD